MDLRDRLDSLLDRSVATPEREKKDLIIEALRARIDRISVRKPPMARIQPHEEPSSLEQTLSGAEVTTEAGPVFVAEYHYPPDYLHCKRKLEIPMKALGKWLPALMGCPLVKPLSFADAIFLDTETTGISGGSGTYVFLVGVGFFTDKGFTINQFFMRDFHEEPGLLNLINRLVNDRSWLVTFNGKAFDLNLLATRFALSRMPFPLGRLPHWDLLATSRRVFKPRIGSCSLSNIEREVLGFKRQGDMEGFEIPATYHRFIRDGDARPLARLFHHNRLDILSMVTLVTLMLQALDTIESIPEFTSWDFLGLGRVMAKSDCTAACRLWSHGLSMADNEQVVYSLKRELGNAAKRVGDYEQAAAFWQEMLNFSLPDPYVHEELAKHCEHKLGDYDTALTLVEEALEFFGYRRKWREPLQYRRDRLLKKVKRHLPNRNSFLGACPK